MGNRYAGDGDAGQVDVFRDAGRDTYLEQDENGEIHAGWSFPNLMDPSDLAPTEESQKSLHWRIPVYFTVNAEEYSDAIELLAERLEEAGIPYELE